jgi:hypothetical protein
LDRPSFERLLDEHQAQEQEDAWERAAQGDREARRPQAERLTVHFADLRIGDFMTAESGPQARWVEVVDVTRSKGMPESLKVTFMTPQPLGVGMHSRHVIDRAAVDEVVVDNSCRGSRHWRAKAARGRLSGLAE